MAFEAAGEQARERDRTGSQGPWAATSHRPQKAFVDFRNILSLTSWKLLKDFELTSLMITVTLTTSLAILLRIIVGKRDKFNRRKIGFRKSLQ